MSEQLPEQQKVSVAVDPRRPVRRVVVGGAVAAALAAALAVAVATQGGAASSAGATRADAPSSVAQLPTDWLPRDSRSGPYRGTGSTGSTATAVTAATAQQQVGVVTIYTKLGYQDAASAGTGMILSADGRVLTNNHVIDGATAIEVTDESTGRSYTATVLGTDASADVALLQLDGASGLTPVTLDDGQGVTADDRVTAIGNAEGTGDLVAAAGTVLDTNQSMTASTGMGSAPESLSGLIEFRAGVVSGDSGGPLLDAEGQVVGITTAASSGPGATTAYAIDISDALAVVHQIASGNEGAGVTIGYPAFLGVYFSSTPFALPGSSSGGALIGGVIDGTPAAAAGLAAGDTITSIGGLPVSSSDELASALAGYDPGDQVTITWVSGGTGATSSATVTLAAGPAD